MDGHLPRRVATGTALLLAMAAASARLDPFAFALAIGLVALAGGWEWTRLAGLSRWPGRLAALAALAGLLAGLGLLLGVAPDARALRAAPAAAALGIGLAWWALVLFLLPGYPENAGRWNSRPGIAAMGALTLAPAWTALVQLKYLHPDGWLVLGLVLMVSAIDTGAFLVGTRFGTRRLAPRLSPSKSWEGAWGGALACLAAGAALLLFVHARVEPLSLSQAAALAAAVAAVAALGIAGDLLESMLKRNCRVKVSGRLLPGHGGFLDRIDSLLAAAPAFAAAVWLTLGRGAG